MLFQLKVTSMPSVQACGKADSHGMHAVDGRGGIDPSHQELSSGGICSIQWLEFFSKPTAGLEKGSALVAQTI